MTAHGKGTAGIGIAARSDPSLVAQIPAQQSTHESITRAQDVEDLDGEAFDDKTVLHTIRNITLKHRAPVRAELKDKGRSGNRADRPQGCNRIGAAPGDVEFLFGADD